MATIYGILNSSTNTGLGSEIKFPFSTPLRIISNDPSFAIDSASLRRLSVSQGVHRWEIETALEPTNNSAEFLVHSVFNNSTKNFYLRMPQVYGVTMTTVSSPTVASNYSAGTSTVNLSGVIGTPTIGEFIRFNNHWKVYMISSAGSGGGTAVGIYPPLRTSIASGEVVYTGDRVTMRGIYDNSNVFGITFTDGILSDPGTVKIIEAI